LAAELKAPTLRAAIDAESRFATIAALREMMILRSICAKNVAREIEDRITIPIGARKLWEISITIRTVIQFAADWTT
jgi:hypothetical protein